MIKKYHKIIIWTLLFVQMILIAIVLLTAKVDDVTLAKGEVQSFNTGWILVREDGTVSTKTPVIALTANAIVGAKEKYLEDGFADYLSKPIREDELMQQLRKYLPDEMIETENPTEQEQDIVDTEPVQQTPPAEDGEEATAASGTQTIEERFPYLNTNAGMTYCMKDESFYLEMIESYVQEDKRELLEKEFAAAS